jgi:hypothetical protein
MNRSGLTALAAVALLAALLSSAPAAVNFPPELQNASQEQKLQYLQTMGERSLRDKIDVGKQRYEERLAFRSEIIAGMRANAAERREEILPQLTKIPSPKSQSGELLSSIVWLSAAAIGVFLLVRLHRRNARA